MDPKTNAAAQTSDDREPASRAATPPTQLEPTQPPGHRIPSSMRTLMRLTPEHLPPDGDILLEHIDAAIEHFAPRNKFEYAEVVRIGRHQHAIATLHAFKDVCHKRMRRVASRVTVKPGWTQPKPGELEAIRATHSTVAGEAKLHALEEANCAYTADDQRLDLNLEYYENDAAIEAAALAVLKELKLGAFALDAEAFRLGLPDQAAFAQLIAAEETRLSKLVDDFERRRSRRLTPPVVDAEFEPA